MLTVAIISEYNPFHKGHEYQIECIRREFGADTAIISIMSGNYVQRGDVAFMPKSERAKCAIMGGANLVLEIPFPFSSASAEFFAKSGIKIAESLGIVDYISFGSESGDIDALYKAAKVYLTPEFKKAFLELSDSIGFPARCELAYKSVAGDCGITFTPNNILAIEYIKALIETDSKIKAHTIKRDGADYNAESIEPVDNQSATAIRFAYSSADSSYALTYVPESSRQIMLDAEKNGDMPTDISKISSAVISKLRLCPSLPEKDYHDANDGLYNRLCNISFEANDINTLLRLSETKNLTRARVRRALLNVFFGVTSSDVKALPRFTQVLGMDSIGMKILKQVKKSEFKVLTKPSVFDDFDETERAQKRLSDMADSIFELTKPIPKHGKSALTFTPFIKK